MKNEPRMALFYAILAAALYALNAPVSKLLLLISIILLVLVLIPVVAIYIILQRRFIEGVERSGIVG